MSKIPHQAFSVEYSNIARQLFTDVDVISGFDKSKTLKIKAIWDTGATNSVITPKVFSLLQLSPIDTAVVKGVNSQEEVSVTIVDIVLLNGVRVPNWRVTVCEVADCDMLIGMDIIHNGDFSVANGNGTTTFSFAIPPFENKTNLVDKADRINERIQKKIKKIK